MLRLGLIAISTVLLASSIASAASLTVSATPLQVFHYPVDYEPPVDDFRLDIQVLFMAGDSGRVIDSTVLGPYVLPSGETYTVGYDGQIRRCPDGVTASYQGLPGPYLAVPGEANVLCVQHGEARGRTISVWAGESAQRLIIPDGPVPGSSAAVVADTEDPVAAGAAESGATSDEAADDHVPADEAVTAKPTGPSDVPASQGDGSSSVDGPGGPQGDDRSATGR